MGTLRVGDALEDRAELVGRLRGVAADLELDERGMPALCNPACVGRVERRADVLHRRHLLEASHNVLDGGVEGKRAHSKRAALDQHALTRGHLEPGVEYPVHAARLTGACPVRIGLLRADLAADGEHEQHERKPAEGGGLPVSCAPAAHTGREVGVLSCARHARSSLGSTTPATLRPRRLEVVGARSDRSSYQPMIRPPTQVGGVPRDHVLSARQKRQVLRT